MRRALGLDRTNFYLLGHSWGGILAIEYALAHQQHLKGLVISNMMSSIPAYNAYAEHVLMPAMDQDVLAEIKRFEAAGVDRRPALRGAADGAPLRPPRPAPAGRRVARPREPRPSPHINQAIYVPMQGPSELGARRQAPDELGSNRRPRGASPSRRW